MKKTILFFATSALLFACDSSEPEQKTEINQTQKSPESLKEPKATQVVSNEEGITNEEEITIEEEVQTETKVIQDKPSTASEQFDQLVGTWIFTKATAGEVDRSAKYPMGYLNSETKKMTLQADGTIQYEKDVVDIMKIEKATWKIEKHETKSFYYFVTTIIAGGVTETSKEKILTSTDKQFIFGKRFTVEYAAL